MFLPLREVFLCSVVSLELQRYLKAAKGFLPSSAHEPELLTQASFCRLCHQDCLLTCVSHKLLLASSCELLCVHSE